MATELTELYKVIGPPGTGKTTLVSDQCVNAAAKLGKNRVMVCSLTKAAALSAASATGSIDRDMIGTLHSFCFRALKSPKLVDSKDVLEWNDQHPTMRLTPALLSSNKTVDEFGATQAGDNTFRAVEVNRAKELPLELWTPKATLFFEIWQKWKAKRYLRDFTDLIADSLQTVYSPPGNPLAIFVDEAQDLSSLELSLINKWTIDVETAVLVGDDDQALYHWRGSEKQLLGANPWKVLERSYRVPEAVLDHALTFLETGVSDRTPVKYLPRLEDPADPASPVAVGSVDRKPWRWKFEPASYMEDVARLSEEGSVMILVSCEYMLARIKKWLRDNGVAYHNPFAQRWNPLTPARGVSTPTRLLALLKRLEQDPFYIWNHLEVLSWLPLFKLWNEKTKTGVFNGRAAKERLEAIGEHWEEDHRGSAFQATIHPDAMNHFRNLDLDWLKASMTSTKAKSATYPLAIAAKHGLAALEREPKIIIGTVHSVKGGQADTVVLFPDVSPSGYRLSRQPGWQFRDAIFRLFYVGMTRARNRLILCQPSSGLAARL